MLLIEKIISLYQILLLKRTVFPENVQKNAKIFNIGPTELSTTTKTATIFCVLAEATTAKYATKVRIQRGYLKSECVTIHCSLAFYQVHYQQYGVGNAEDQNKAKGPAE